MIRERLLKYLCLDRQAEINVEVTNLLASLNLALQMCLMAQRKHAEVLGLLEERIAALEEKFKPMEHIQ